MLFRSYQANHLGAGADTLSGLIDRAEAVEGKRPIVIVGQGVLTRPDGAAILSLAAKLAIKLGAVVAGWNGLSILHTAASRVGALDLGFVPGEGGLDAATMAAGGALDVLFLLGADEIDVAPGAFVVYQGSHGDRGAHRADVILPGAAYTEKSGTYVNTEGRVQLANRAAFPPGQAREDWAIIRALSDAVGQRLPFDSLQALRAAIYAAHPHLAAIDHVSPASADAASALAAVGGKPDVSPFKSAVSDFYLTNPIARASAVMAECSALSAGALPLAAE